MITVKINTEYKGMIAIRQQFVTEAIRKHEPLEIIHNGSSMIIQPGEIGHRGKRSAERFPDRYDQRPPCYLYYFVWMPEAEQVMLKI